MKIKFIVSVGVLIGTSAFGQYPEFGFIDFESVPNVGVPSEGLAIGTQYQSTLGVSFSIVGDSNQFPVIASGGNPQVAFDRDFGPSDSPMFDGDRGLTAGGSVGSIQSIQISFSPPVKGYRLFVVDIDGAERFTVTSFNGPMALGQPLVISSGAPGTGDGIATVAAGAFTTITHAIITPASTANPPGGVDYAIDGLTYSRAAQNPLEGPFIRMAQESAPGAGDFEQQVLAVIRPWQSQAGVQASRFYTDISNVMNLAVGTFWGLIVRPEVNVSHVLFGETDEGLGIYLQHDASFNENFEGGHTEMRIVLDVDTDARRLVEDDASGTNGPDIYAPGLGIFASEFSSVHSWGAFGTDGEAICGLDDNWTAVVSFENTDGNPATPAHSGFVAWRVFSSGGFTALPLGLTEGRRVQFKRIDACIAVNSPPDQSVCAGDSLQLAVVPKLFQSSIGGLSYQWRKNGVPLQSGTHVMGVTTPTLTLSNVTPASAGSYDCEVFSMCGDALSVAATLTVAQPAFGDADENCLVDLIDFQSFADCLSGPDANPPFDCAALDFDVDDEIDLEDFGGFQRGFTGAGN